MRRRITHVLDATPGGSFLDDMEGNEPNDIWACCIDGGKEAFKKTSWPQPHVEYLRCSMGRSVKVCMHYCHSYVFRLLPYVGRLTCAVVGGLGACHKRRTGFFHWVHYQSQTWKHCNALGVLQCWVYPCMRTRGSCEYIHGLPMHLR